jgi:AAA domain
VNTYANGTPVASDAFERIVGYLRALDRKVITRGPDRATAQCPGPMHQNGDRTPSLSVSRGRGLVLINCWAGCGPKDVMAAMGKPMSDLFDNQRDMIWQYADGRTERKYYDKNGEKKFSQPGTNNPTTVLYTMAAPDEQLDLIKEAVAAGQTILLCEGAKDVDTIMTRYPGQVAVSAPQGAANFHLVDATPLHGAEVIAIVHKDLAGEKGWAPKVIAKLEGKAKSLDFMQAKVVGIDGADAADHINAGHTLAELVPWCPPEPDGQADPGVDDAWLAEQEAAFQLAHDVAALAYRMKVRDLARQKIAQGAAAGLTLPAMIGLTEFLATPDPEKKYLIDGVWPKGGRVLFSAQWKSGKSTARDNTVRCLADGETFLGTFAVQPITEGTIVVIDDELHPDTMRRWMRDQGIVNTDRVVVVPLRGHAATFDLTLPEVRALWVQRLRAVQAAVVILDCLRPILDALGLSEDKEAGQFLVAFDAMLQEAGVAEAMIIHHMGHGNERARGDSRILDWGDSLWKLVRDNTDEEIPIEERARYFTAFGRDVRVRESRLSYDETTRRLTIAGGTRRESKGDEAWPDVREFIQNHPNCSANRIEKDLAGTYGKEAIRAAINAAEKRGDVHIERTGKGLANLHRLSERVVIEEATEPIQPAIEEATSPTSPDLATANPRTPPRHLATSLIERGGGGGTEEAIPPTSRLARLTDPKQESGEQ